MTAWRFAPKYGENKAPMQALSRAVGGSILVFSITQAAGAQRMGVSGTVIEELSRTPVYGATIRLLTDTGRVLATTTTGVLGGFRLDVSSPGVYRLRIEGLGYQRKDSAPIEIEAGRVRVVELEVARQPMLLDSVMIRAAADAPPLGPTQQLVHGRLLDDDTGEPIPDGTIELRDARKKTAAKVITDASGMFRLVTPSPGEYSLYVERPGYRPSEQSDLNLTLGDTVVVEFRLSRRAALLAPVLVTASAKPWMERERRRGIEQLYVRMKRFGKQRNAQFILRDTIDAYDQRSFTIGQMLDRVVRVPFERGPGCLGSKTYVERFPIDVSSAYYELNNLDVIEVYSHPAIPAEFAAPMFAPGQRSAAVRPCRVIVYWTRPRIKSR
jgi:hypothetical protein